MSTVDGVRSSSPRRTALIGAAVATGCLLAASLVVPDAGASAAAGTGGLAKTKTGTTATASARSTTRRATETTTCLDDCTRIPLDDFENPRLPSWSPIGTASLASFGGIVLHGSGAMAISNATAAAGAAGTFDLGARRAYVSLALRIEPVPITGATAMPGKSRVVVLLDSADGTRTEVTDDVRDGGWTTIGGWVDGPTVRVSVLLSPSCAPTPIGRLLVDDLVATAKPSDVVTTTTVTTAGTTAVTTTGPTTAAPAAQQATTRFTSRPATSTPATCPSGPTTTTRPPYLTYGFENGTKDGWAPVGDSKVRVRAASAQAGAFGLQITKLSGAKRNGATLTVPLAAVPGSGEWVQVSLWVRGPQVKTATTTTSKTLKAAEPQAQKPPITPPRLYLLGPDGELAAPVNYLPSKQWTQIVGAVQVPADSDTITLTLIQEPQQLPCGPYALPVGSIDVDNLMFLRSTEVIGSLPTTAPRVAPQVTRCPITKY